MLHFQIAIASPATFVANINEGIFYIISDLHLLHDLHAVPIKLLECPEVNAAPASLPTARLALPVITPVPTASKPIINTIFWCSRSISSTFTHNYVTVSCSYNYQQTLLQSYCRDLSLLHYQHHIRLSESDVVYGLCAISS